jgi:catechol 2,3-dioxygenase-like lactoylglutathione lyase family enzyme
VEATATEAKWKIQQVPNEFTRRYLMISNAQLTPILPVVDVSRATGFYRDRLGLKDLGDEPGGNHLLQTSSGATIGLMPAEEGVQSSHTVLTFEVDDITSEVKDLESRGVGFYDYDLPDLKTVDHVCVMGSEKAAWFADTEGNILCLHQHMIGDMAP